MKIQGQTYDTMHAAMKAAVEHLGGPAKVQGLRAQNTWTEGRLLWHVWEIANRSLRYDDAHPAFASGTWTRVCPQQPGFDLYSDDTIYDSHIESALRKIAKDIRLI
jgi:predicted 2-oxoglutarate/Fe(II)-dependent dioxygenase YbiX